MTDKKPDWFEKLKSHGLTLLNVFLSAIKPPSLLPIWQWLELHYEVTEGNYLPGKINFDLFPASKFFFEHAQDYRCRKISEMVCHQSGKTENMMMLFCWSVVESPISTIWVMADADMLEQVAKTRIFPAIEACQPTYELAPKEREKWTKNMIQFDSMTLLLRGSNSKKKLKSNPMGKIFCDERSDWKPGSIGTLRERLTTFSNSQEISAGTPGVLNDEWHNDWKEGSQTFMHFRCLDCGHSQPFRFGRDPSVFFPEKRERGGVVWPCNEETKPNGKWDLEDGGAVERLSRYECEKCGRQYANAEKVLLIKAVLQHHRNPNALPHHYSSSRNVLMMPWRSCSFGKVAVKFLKAVAAMKGGDLEPMRTFVTEDLGEPWTPPSIYKQKGDLLERIGDYKMGQYWMEPDGVTREKGTAFILTFDRQMDYLPYVVRQVRKNAQSRLVHIGKVPTMEDLRAVQMELKILNQCMWGDDGGLFANEFRQKCLQWNWNILKGDDREHFTIHHIEEGVDKSFWQGWRETKFDAGIGTTRQGFATVKAWLWSNPWFKDRLYFSILRGLGTLWEIPSDITTEYLDQLNANEWREKQNAQGQIEGYFHETGPDHFADCELMQDVVVSIAGWNRTAHQPQAKPNSP